MQSYTSIHTRELSFHFCQLSCKRIVKGVYTVKAWSLVYYEKKTCYEARTTNNLLSLILYLLPELRSYHKTKTSMQDNHTGLSQIQIKIFL